LPLPTRQESECKDVMINMFCHAFILFSAIALFGCSHDAYKILLPAPVSLAITAGEWVLRDTSRFYVVEVEASGSSPEIARKDAFKLAVSKALGSLIVAEREIKDNTIIRDEFLNYSSGYVEDYEVQSEMFDGVSHKVRMKIWVSEARIADRVRASGASASTIDGRKVANKLETYKEQILVSDRLIESLLKDFPDKTFEVVMGSYSTRIVNRRMEIVIPYKIQWDQSYIDALEDALLRTREGSDPLDWKFARLPSVIAIKKKNSWFKSFSAYSDHTKEALFHKYFVESRPHLLFSIYGRNNSLIFMQCYEFPQISGYLDAPQFFAVNTSDSSFAIFGDFEYRNEAVYITNFDSHNLSEIDKVFLKIVPLRACPVQKN
jgi:hypothetical protein